MAATPAPFCPQCGAPLQGSKRFCTNCGATIETNASSPTIAASQTPPPAGGVNPGQAGLPRTTHPNAETAYPKPPNALPGGSIYANNNESFLPPPPPPSSYNPYTNSLPGGTQSYAQTTSPNIPPPVATPAPQGGAYQVPAYAQKPKGNRGCAATSIILLLVLALGIGGYFLFHARATPNAGTNNTGTSGTPASGANSTTTSTNQGSTPTVSANAVTTEQLNLQVIYANVNITVISAQLAKSFPDDTDTTAGSAGVVRINLRENNTTTSNPDYLESESMLLLLPGGTTVQPANSPQVISPAQGVNRLNWLDFPLSVQATLNQLILRIGKQSQNQMDIPLQPKADLSKYQDKTSNPNAQFKYGTLNMTLKTATLSYSYADQQATTGNLYAIITLSEINSTSDSIDLYPGNYFRLQAGGNSIEPDSTYTLPPAVNANTTASGVVAFLVPQGTTAFTLVMLAQANASPAISQATQSFQIQ